MPDGIVRVFRANSQGGLSIQGTQSLNYVPVKADIEVNLGADDLVVYSRGAGNCPMELLLGFPRDPKFKLRPVIKLLQEEILPLKSTVEWGPNIAFNITGAMNLHPRAAIQFRQTDEKDDYVKFWDQINADI